jgi:hypothetical protein
MRIRLGRNSCFAAFLFGVLGSFALGAHAQVFWSGNGHWYEVVTDTATWDEANAAAAARSHMGMPGHLATITSGAENDFISDLSPGSDPPALYILGGYQNPAATTFGGGWQWVTGEAFSYTNWCGPGCGVEPNDGNDGSEAVGSGDEDRLHFFHAGNVNADGLTWNDYPGGEQAGYVVEYEVTTVIPEPESYALLLAGLGLLGFAARRKGVELLST